MYTLILIMSIYTRNPAMIAVNTSYDNLAKCQVAGEAYKTSYKWADENRNYACIPK